MTISLNNNKNILLIIILCVILALIITFLIMDWSSGVSDLSEIIKYIVSCCCVIIALLTGKDALDKRDALLLRIAFGFIFLADTKCEYQPDDYQTHIEQGKMLGLKGE